MFITPSSADSAATSMGAVPASGDTGAPGTTSAAPSAGLTGPPDHHKRVRIRRRFGLRA